MKPCRMHLELGAYVLQALEEKDAATVERHLAGCEACRAEADELTLAASWLTVLRPEDLEQLGVSEVPPPPEGAASASLLPASRAPRVRRVHRVRRRAVTLAAAAVLAAVATVPAVHLLGGQDQAPQAVVLHGVGQHSGARAELSMVARDGGTGLHLTLAGAPTHGWCYLVARARGGRVETAASWPADAHGRVDVTGATGIPTDRLTNLDVVTDTGRTLVSFRVPQHAT